MEDLQLCHIHRQDEGERLVAHIRRQQRKFHRAVDPANTVCAVPGCGLFEIIADRTVDSWDSDSDDLKTNGSRCALTMNKKSLHIERLQATWQERPAKHRSSVMPINLPIIIGAALSEIKHWQFPIRLEKHEVRNSRRTATDLIVLGSFAHAQARPPSRIKRTTF